MNLMEGLIQETNRCREVLAEYEKIPTGAFGAMMIREDIKEAEAAMASDDAVRMLAAYKRVKEVE